ncbi:hypothetical protein [Cyclobacterium sp.]|uniref:hypothetical protein n=1 Tax=Cyclobacterium sp. TaxID=1966343 RepID=UPI00198E8074|nr:hypothetical protein [Cyclobacterium sp.]MBD3630501.1 hypothetical protein [Cyclobacterium sp.]
MDIQLTITKDLLREYFRHLFPLDAKGRYLIDRSSDLGKAICSFVRYTEVKPERDPQALQLLLPKTDSLKNAPNYHLYFSREDLLRINDLVEVFFHIDFDRFYLKGRKLGMMQKDIIESFIVSRKLTNLLQDNETLKKREYREGLRLLQLRCKTLINKAYYRHEKIELGMQNILVN